MTLIQSHFHEGQGYEPLHVAEGWQVAQLNFLPALSFEQMCKLERHNRTDEIFICFRGAPVLVAAEEAGEELRFKFVKMSTAVTYNIPRGVWHWIVMHPEDVAFIAERSNTHLEDVEYRELSPEQLQRFVHTYREELAAL